MCSSLVEVGYALVVIGSGLGRAGLSVGLFFFASGDL